MPSNLTHDPKERLAIVDALRGLALLGVVVMNYSVFFNLGGARNIQLPGIINFCLQTFTGVTWMTLSFLFGFGFAVLIQKPGEKNMSSSKVFSLRMFWLLVFALINSAVFFADILKDYAVLGVALLLFRKCSPRTLLFLCLALFFILPYVNSWVWSYSRSLSHTKVSDLLYLYESENLFDVLKFGLLATYFRQIINPPYAITIHLSMLCCFLAGLAVQKTGFFETLTEQARHLKKLFWFAFFCCILFSNVFHFSFEHGRPTFRFPVASQRYLLSCTVLAIVTVTWLYAEGKFGKIFNLLKVTGRMTLTNYLVQNVLSLLLFSGFGFGLVNQLPLPWYLLAGIIIFVMQVGYSNWWLAKYNFGPAEWVWRRLSYGTSLPFKKLKSH